MNNHAIIKCNSGKYGWSEKQQQISQAAREHNLAIVAAQHGIDSAEYYAYEATWGQGSHADNPLEGDSIATAMDDHREFLIAMYGENSPEFVRAYNEYLDSLDTMVLSEMDVEIGETPTNENTMIVIIYGSNQFPGDGSDFDQLTTDLLEDYQETWPFSPGYNPSELAEMNEYGPDNAFEDIQELISSRTTNNPDLKNIVFVGHSWGGGMIVELADWLSKSKDINLNIAGVAYVDAVDLYDATGESRIPIGTSSMLNIYQSITVGTAEQDSILHLNGKPVKDSDTLDYYSEIDFDREENKESHRTIDEASIPYVYEYIRGIVNIPDDQ